MALTDVVVRGAKAGDKPVRLFDGGGLYLEVAPSGGKWWRLKYRWSGKEKRLSLGTFPETSLKRAREARDKARRKLAEGIDPGLERRQAREQSRRLVEHAFEPVARAWLSHRSPAWIAKTRGTILASLERHVFPELGMRPIAEVQPREIRAVVQAIEASGAGEMAGRVFQRIRAIYRYAVAHDLTETDPTYPLKPAEILKPRRVTHRAALPLRELPGFVEKLQTYDGDLATRLALEMLLHTAARPGDVRGALWNEIDLDTSLWRIPAERMKMKTEHLVPLSRQTCALLKILQSTSAGQAFLFPSPFYPGKPLSDGTLNSALARMGYKGIATAHGLLSSTSQPVNCV